MAAGLLGGDVPPLHHVLHQGVIPGHLVDALLIDMIRPAVPHIGDDHAPVEGNGGDQGGPHAVILLRGPGGLPHGAVRQGHRHHGDLPEPVRLGLLREALFHLRGKGVHGNAAGQLPAGGPAHPVADHADRVSKSRLHRVGVLILFTDEAGVGHAP